MTRESTRRGVSFPGLFTAFGMLLLAFAGVSYSLGWLEFSGNADRAVIEFDKAQAVSDTNDAIERGEELFQDAGEPLKKAGDSLSADDRDDTTNGA